VRAAKNMYTEETKHQAIKLRQNHPDAELRLWKHLRNRRLAGYKFLRQHPIGPYIADFVCREVRLVIEVDGGQHAEHIESDAHRTAFFEEKGFRVIRFWNHDVLRNTESVLNMILSELQQPSSQPFSRKREKGKNNEQSYPLSRARERAGVRARPDCQEPT